MVFPFYLLLNKFDNYFLNIAIIGFDKSKKDVLFSQKSYKDFPKITIMVRTTSSQIHLYQFYCMWLRTMVLFWPASYGDVTVILDAESKKDHHFGDTILTQVRQHYPDYTLKVLYEPLPKNRKILNTKSKSAGYNRQLFSTFFADFYTNDSIIAYTDTDILFLTPITKEYMLKRTKLKVFGNGNFQLGFVPSWGKTTKKAIGLPMVANFMITFPQLIYRQTITNCRNHILNHLKTSDFEIAFPLFYPHSSIISPINIIMSYAWFFEYEKYDWHLKIQDLVKHNKMLPSAHKVSTEDTIPSLVAVAHISDHKKWMQHRVIPGYCEAMRVQGQPPANCSSIKHNLNQICNFHESFFHAPWPNLHDWCSEGQAHACCQKALDEHYRHVGHMAACGIHTVRRGRAKLVERLAKDMGVTCEDFKEPL